MDEWIKKENKIKSICQQVSSNYCYLSHWIINSVSLSRRKGEMRNINPNTDSCYQYWIRWSGLFTILCFSLLPFSLSANLSLLLFFSFHKGIPVIFTSSLSLSVYTLDSLLQFFTVKKEEFDVPPKTRRTQEGGVSNLNKNGRGSDENSKERAKNKKKSSSMFFSYHCIIHVAFKAMPCPSFFFLLPHPHTFLTFPSIQLHFLTPLRRIILIKTKYWFSVCFYSKRM